MSAIKSEQKTAMLRKKLGIMIGLLTAEFVLGMLVNLFSAEVLMQSPALIRIAFLTHAIIGLLLVIGGVWTFLLGLKSKEASLKRMAIIIALSILIAFGGGIATI